MTRNRRVVVHNVPYFITCQVHTDVTLPVVAVMAAAVLDALKRIRSRWGAELHAYVVMPDHWHALITTQPPHDISRVMNSVKTRSAMAIQNRTGLAGPVWQPRFYDRVCRDAGEFGETLAYIHHNPVGAGLVESPAEWPWSSWYEYAEGGVAPVTVDRVEGPFDAKWTEWARHRPPRRR